MATRGSAAWPFLSRFSLFTFTALALGCGAAGSSADEDFRYEQPLLSIEGRTLDGSVVQHLRARDQLSDTAARQRARHTLLLVAAAELRNSDSHQPRALIDASRRRYLERAASVRLWLDEYFEPRNEVSNVPNAFTDRALNSERMMQRHFHPRYHFVCQLLAQPAQSEMIEDAQGRKVPAFDIKADRQWQAAAIALARPLFEQIQALPREYLARDDCDLFDSILKLADPNSSDGRIQLRSETIVMDSSPEASGRWDPDFLAAVGRPDQPTQVGPFFTQFGMHFVYIPKILEERLPDGSLPEAELELRRREFLQSEMHERWLSEAFANEVKELRARVGVRLSPELSRGGPGQPGR